MLKEGAIYTVRVVNTLPRIGEDYILYDIGSTLYYYWDEGTYRSLTKVSSDVPSALLDGSGNLTSNSFVVDGVTSTITSSANTFELKQTGDTFGTSGIRFQNRSGMAGGQFFNDGLDLVEIQFKPSVGNTGAFRWESRSGQTYFSSADELQIGKIPIATAGNIWLAVGSSGAVFFPEGTQRVGIGVTTLVEALTVDGNVLADSYIIPSGTSSQFLKADGSVDASTYLTAEINDLTAAVVWANVPDSNITESSVTQHEGALTVKNSEYITVPSPTASEDRGMFFTEEAITITKMVAVCQGTTPSVTWTIRHSTDRSATGNEVVTSGTVTTNTTTGDVVTSFNDATIPANSFVWLETTATSGTIIEFNLTVIYTRD